MTAADEIAEFYVHTAAVETKLGDGANGTEYASPVNVACFAPVAARLVKAPDGQQVIAAITLTCASDQYPLFTPGSRVTVNGRPGLVITAEQATSGDLDLPDHCQVSLT